jgi:hypothetical protein
MNTPAQEHDNTPATPAQLARPLLHSPARLPEELEGLIDLNAWAESLVNGRPYKEPEPGYLARLLTMQTLEAVSPEAVFSPNDLEGLQRLIPNVPGMGTGPTEITGLYVAASDMTEGAPCYMILDLTDLETGATRKTTTGATQLQAQILRLLGFGVWPIRCQIKRTERKDRGGRYLFWLFPVD